MTIDNAFLPDNLTHCLLNLNLTLITKYVFCYHEKFVPDCE